MYHLSLKKRIWTTKSEKSSPNSLFFARCGTLGRRGNTRENRIRFCIFMDAREYTGINGKSGGFTEKEREHIRERMQFLVQMDYSVKEGPHSITYCYGDIEIMVLSGKYDETDTIIVRRKAYYDYSNLREGKRKFLYTMFGVNKDSNLEKIVKKNGRKDIFDHDRMERFDIFADYLEANLDSILNDPGPKALRKYHNR